MADGRGGEDVRVLLVVVLPNWAESPRMAERACWTASGLALLSVTTRVAWFDSMAAWSSWLTSCSTSSNRGSGAASRR